MARPHKNPVEGIFGFTKGTCLIRRHCGKSALSCRTEVGQTLQRGKHSSVVAGGEQISQGLSHLFRRDGGSDGNAFRQGDRGKRGEGRGHGSSIRGFLMKL